MKTPTTRLKPVVLRSTALRADAEGKFPTEIELVRAGEWKTPWHGDFTITIADIDESIGHFNAGVYRVNGTEPLPVSLDHLGGGSPAAARIDRVYRIDDRYMASVTWTELGKEKLDRDEYRYVSFEFHTRAMPYEDPENEGVFLNNVLTGATLTNDPLFKKQKPVMASARSGDNNTEGDQVNLADLLAKKIEDLTDEEKAFIAEHKEELTDEQRTTYGLNEETAEEKEAREKAEADAKAQAEKEAADKEAADKKAAEESKELEQLKASAKSMTPEKLRKLEADAKAGREAQQELLKTRLTASVQAHVDRGAVKSDQADEAVSILMASSEKQRERLDAFLGGLPGNPLIASASGKEGGDDTKVELTDEEKSIAADFGNTPEDIEAYKKAQAGK